EAADGELARRALEDWRGVTAPGGEGWDVFEERVSRALEAILAGPMPCVVVAHMAVNACCARRLTGAAGTEFHQAYGEAIAYEW
ncbi:MAG: histidine phosphatase family protein, partial [Bryobacteraceae bacterium]